MTKRKNQVKRKMKRAIEDDADETALNNANEGMCDEEEESWCLSRSLTLEDLTSEHKAMRDSDDCNLQAWLVCAGNKTSMEWNTCADCMLRDCENWPSEERCNDVEESLPIDVNLELHIREKCTKDKELKTPDHASKNALLHQFINNTIAQNSKESINDMPPLINSTLHQSTNKEVNMTGSLVSDLTSDFSSVNVNVTEEEANAETECAEIGNNNDNNTSTASRKKTPMKTSFCACFQNSQKEGLIKLNPEEHNKNTKELRKEGCFVVCAPCEKFRNKSNGVVNLRRRCYQHYFKEQCCRTEARGVRMRTLEDAKKTKSNKEVKSCSQSVLHNFFPPKGAESKIGNENDNSDDRDLNADAQEGLARNDSVSETSNVSIARQGSICFDHHSFLH